MKLRKTRVLVASRFARFRPPKYVSSLQLACFSFCIHSLSVAESAYTETCWDMRFTASEDARMSGSETCVTVSSKPQKRENATPFGALHCEARGFLLISIPTRLAPVLTLSRVGPLNDVSGPAR